jgi:hypothetical protein
MSDISKCAGKDCPLKTLCKRFTAKENRCGQAWIQEYYSEEDLSCEMFYPN